MASRRNRKNTRRNRKNNMMGGTSVPMPNSCPPGTKWDNSAKQCLADIILCEEVGGSYKNNTKECQPPFTKLNGNTLTEVNGGKRRRRNMTRRNRKH